MRKLNGLQGGGILVHRVHVKDGPGGLPGICKKRAEPGPGQDRVAHEDQLSSDRTLVGALSFQLHPKTHSFKQDKLYSYSSQSASFSPYKR